MSSRARFSWPRCVTPCRPFSEWMPTTPPVGAWNDRAFGMFLLGGAHRRSLFRNAQRPDRAGQDDGLDDPFLLALHLPECLFQGTLASRGAAISRRHGSRRRMGGGLGHGRRGHAETIPGRDEFDLPCLERVWNSPRGGQRFASSSPTRRSMPRSPPRDSKDGGSVSRSGFSRPC